MKIDIITFRYNSPNASDSRPKVMVIKEDDNYIEGFNLNYVGKQEIDLEYFIQHTSEEDLGNEFVSSYGWGHAYRKYSKDYVSHQKTILSITNAR